MRPWNRYLLALCLLFVLPAQAQLLGTAFTYQGSLSESAAPANGNFDFEFSIFATPFGGTLLAAPLTLNAVAVDNGLFTVSLDFGDQYIGQPRWLEIRVRRTGAPTLTPLAPRQALAPTPFALHAEFVADGSVVAASLQNRTVTSDKIALLAVGTTELANGAVTSAKLADSAVTFAKLGKEAVGTSKIANGAVGRNQVDATAVQLHVAALCPRSVPLIGISAEGHQSAITPRVGRTGFPAIGSASWCAATDDPWSRTRGRGSTTAPMPTV